MFSTGANTLYLILVLYSTYTLFWGHIIITILWFSNSIDSCSGRSIEIYVGYLNSKEKKLYWNCTKQILFYYIHVFTTFNY